MAVKTGKEVIVSYDTTNGFKSGDSAITEIDAKKKYTAIRVDGLSFAKAKSATYSMNGTTLTITTTDGKTLTVKNASKIQYIQTDYEKSGKTEAYNLTDLITDNLITNSNAITANSKNKATGTNYNDTFTNTSNPDIFTGGLGTNTFNYSKGNGNDTINLTAKENLVLNLSSISSSDITYSYANKNKDLVLNIANADTTNTITLKNFGSKDVVGSTSSIILKTFDNNTGIDLKEEYITNTVKSNFTGTYLNDKITVDSGYTNAKNKGLTLNGGAGNDQITGSKYSDTINGGNGNDTIYGSEGNDTITGGKGTNTIDYSSFKTSGANFGTDTINLTNGETLNITGLQGTLSYAQGTGKNKNDLIVSSDYGKITLKNYYSKSTGATVYINGDDLTTTQKFEFSETNLSKGAITTSALADKITINLTSPTKSVTKKGVTTDYGATINAGAGDDIITGSDYNDTINAGAGDDTIYASKGNDTITAGAGENTINYSSIATDFGNDIINLTKGETLDITGLSGDLGYEKSGKNDLKVISKSGDTTYGTITLKNYYSKSTGATVTINGDDLTKTATELTTYDKSYFKYNESKKKYTVTKFTGSALADKIDASGLTTPVKSTTNKKTGITTNAGVTINTGLGNDTIIGSKYNDTITGGVGTNTIDYTAAALKTADGFGTDTINLTKGETLNIKLTDYSLDYKQSGKDLKIIATNGTTEAGTIILKNYYSKDLGATVNIIQVDETLNLAETVTTLTTKEVTSSYTGSALADDISAGEYKIYTDKAKTTVSTDYTKKGLTLNGGAGSDIITGSDYSDTIKAGTTGNNTITGGKGNDKLYGGTSANSATTFVFNSGDGKDTIYSGKGSDTIKFAKDVDLSDLIFKRSGKNLVIQYGTDESGNPTGTITINNYYKSATSDTVTSSVKYIEIDGVDTFDIETVMDSLSDDETITGTDDDDLIIATGSGQTITGGSGNDTIIGSKGDDTYKFTNGSGFSDAKHTTIVMDEGNDTIYFPNSFAGFGGFEFKKQDDDLRIWYNATYNISSNVTTAGVSEYQGSEVYKTHSGTGYPVYCSSIIVKDYFTTDNPTIDKIQTAKGTYYISTDSKAEWSGGVGYINYLGSYTYNRDISLTDVVLGEFGSYEDNVYRGSKYADRVETSGRGDTVYTYGGNDYVRSNGSDTIYTGDGNDTIYIASGNRNRNITIHGGTGNDKITVQYDVTSTIYTNSADEGKDTTTGTVDTVEISNTGTYSQTVYAQSETNEIINDASGDDKYYAYIDQKTTITDKGGTDTLTFTNTSGETDGQLTVSDSRNLHVLFNVSSTGSYSSASDVGDILITNTATKDNFTAWTSSGSFKGVSVANNAIETINSSDSAYLTSAKIAELAASVASWLANNSYGSYSDVANVFSTGSDDAITALIAQFDTANWQTA